MDHLIVGDTETSGLGGDHGVVEIAWVEIDDDMTVINQVRRLVNPGVPISFSAMGVHHITNEMVANEPPLADVIAQEAPGFKEREVLLIAHNAPFDAKYFQPHVGKLNTLCTLKLARRAFPEAPDHKLPTLMYYLGLPVLGNHNALDDVLTCLGVLKKCSEALGMDLEGVYNLMRKPQLVTIMPFGKEHKGKPLTEVPHKFLSWCLGLADLDSDLRYSIELEMKNRRKKA